MSDQVIKFIRDGDGDIRTTNDVDYSLTSQYQNLRVFAKGIVPSSGTPYELEHNLGFYPAFDAYIKKDNNYYLNYFRANAGFKGALNPKGISFSTVSTDLTKMYIEAGGDTVFLIYANPLSPALGHNYDYEGQTGIRLSKDPFPINLGIGVEFVNTHLQMPMIVQRGSISVTVPEIIAPEMTGDYYYGSDEVTIPNPLGKSVHIISDNLFTQFAGYDSLRPENPLFNPIFEDTTGFTMWINDNEIGLNAVTEIANYSIVNPYVKPETTYTIDFILTNIKLP